MNIKSFQYKRFYALPKTAIKLFYVEGSEHICHLYEPIKNSFYIDNDNFKNPYFKTENDAQQFIDRINNNEVTA